MQSIFFFLLLLSFGVVLVFGAGLWLHFSMQKDNRRNRETALKAQSDEPGYDNR
ncbi:hypothetical protein [Coraliomargarita parva]|uniref:hypothetical protein n=1 Tax=Coraliomargarita parva TaxID=3014050 RepID=UPI0022B44E52|nr:hypothetical protein [Coraliomargarita parva]